MRPTDASTVTRLDLARHNEDLVMAENALQGERLVAWVRLATLLLISLSQLLARQLTEVRSPPDGWQVGATLLYVVFALCVPFVLRGQRPNPRRALVAPLLLTWVDFAYYGFMGLRYAEVGPATPQMGAAVLALALCWSVARYSWVHVFTSTFLACATYMAVTLYEGQGRLLAANLFVLGCFSALGLLIGLTRARVRRMFLELRRRDSLTRLLPRQVADRVMELSGGQLEPVQREVTVMFTDIRDFTRYGEGRPPAEVLAFLTDYFGHMARLVKAHEGMVNKFLGDGMLAVWGVPERCEAHAVRALQCALDMRVLLAELNQVRQVRGEPPVHIGVGVHTGVVAAGMLGGAEQQEYTVIGDAVNLASRIEGLTKAHGVDVLVSASTWEQAGGVFRGERLGEERVKGREQPVVVYRLDGRAPSAPMRQVG